MGDEGKEQVDALRFVCFIHTSISDYRNVTFPCKMNPVGGLTEIREEEIQGVHNSLKFHLLYSTQIRVENI